MLSKTGSITEKIDPR